MCDCRAIVAIMLGPFALGIAIWRYRGDLVYVDRRDARSS